MKKAIFFDIDGTLIDCVNGVKNITPKVKAAIKNLQDLGNYVFIASGRPYAFLSEELRNFGFDGFVLMNGAQVIINDKTIFKSPIDKEILLNTIKDFDKFDVEYVLEGDYYSYLKKEHSTLSRFYDNFNIFRDLISSEYNLNDVDIYKIEMMSKNNEGKEYCLNLNNDYFNLLKFDSHTNPDLCAFELYPKKNSKASGIHKVLEYLDIKRENSFAFGDGLNDLEMLSEVGCGIAMGNASDYVKSHAHKVTETVLNDGIVYGIENFIL